MIKCCVDACCCCCCRLTLELPQFGKLAYDLHFAQDNVTLSAVEDVFYLLSDRKPCQMLSAAAGPLHGPSTSAKTHPSCQGGIVSGRHKGSSSSGPSSCGSSGVNSSGSPASGGADTRRVMLPRDLLVPEQFAEALVRLACVRYR